MPPDNKNTFRVSIGGRVERGGPFNIRGKGLGLIGFSGVRIGAEDNQRRPQVCRQRRATPCLETTLFFNNRAPKSSNFLR